MSNSGFYFDLGSNINPFCEDDSKLYQKSEEISRQQKELLEDLKMEQREQM